MRGLLFKIEGENFEDGSVLVDVAKELDLAGMAELGK